MYSIFFRQVFRLLIVCDVCVLIYGSSESIVLRETMTHIPIYSFWHSFYCSVIIGLHTKTFYWVIYKSFIFTVLTLILRHPLRLSYKLCLFTSWLLDLLSFRINCFQVCLFISMLPKSHVVPLIWIMIT